MDAATPERQETPLSQEGPRPEPIIFYGTRWVDHDDGYVLRRVGLTLGAFLATFAGVAVLVFAYQGLAFSATPAWINALVIGAVALCSLIAFARSWSDYVRPGRRDESVESSMRSLRMIGFVGGFLAYGLRSLVEAPGEKLRREEYQTARQSYERRRVTRTGNPALRARAKPKASRRR